MFFLSLEYVLLLSITLLVYWVLPGRRLRLLLLLLASYVFYMSWNPKLIVLLLFSTGLDFLCGHRIAGATGGTRSRWLALSLVGNLGLLGIFKYYGFFVDSLVTLLQTFGVAAHERTLELVLPLGISFYTFQTLSYTIDIYRGHLRPTSSLLEFALFVAFFPQLVAGPIVRAREFLPQLAARQTWDPDNVHLGLERILLGVVKKGVVADNLAIFVDRVFDSPEVYGRSATWLALAAFYGQIYCDFSGYSDIAIGSARLFGFRLPENFRQPWLAVSPREFWQRWHISLSTWLRDYLYIPLGGNRLGARHTYLNLMVTMLLGGLWHGAAWTFVLWGAYHGVLLVADRMAERSGRESAVQRAAGLAVMLLLTMAGWSVFRAQNLEECATLWGRLCGPGGGVFPRSMLTIPFLLASIVAAESWGVVLWGRLCTARRYGWLGRTTVWATGVFLVVFAAPASTQTFIYFVF